MYSFSEKTIIVLLSLFLSWSCMMNAYGAINVSQRQMADIIKHAIQPLIQKYQVPGIAVAITCAGKNYFYNYGVASKKTHRPVTKETLFELGSITKVFTAALASYAKENGKLSLKNDTSHYLSVLKGSNFDKISLLNLGTQTSGLPLFVPNNIKIRKELMDYLRHWNPSYSVGTHRTYSNIGIGLLGISVAKSLQGSFSNLLQQIILTPLQLQHTYFIVPAKEQVNYAQGYTDNNKPIRLQTGELWREAYGLKSSTADLIRFVEANMQEISIPKNLQQALLNTQIAYFKTNYLTQDLVWEQYPYPVTLKQLLIGNGATYLATTKATKIVSSLQPQQEVFINKTGATNGFSAYIAFIPVKKMGIVILANKFYPVTQNVIVGYHILKTLSVAQKLSLR